jgi:hypothetical protein
MITSKQITDLCQQHQGDLQNDLFRFNFGLSEDQIVRISQVMVNYVENVLTDVVSEIMHEIDRNTGR